MDFGKVSRMNGELSDGRRRRGMRKALLVAEMGRVVGEGTGERELIG